MTRKSMSVGKLGKVTFTGPFPFEKVGSAGDGGGTVGLSVGGTNVDTCAQ